MVVYQTIKVIFKDDIRRFRFAPEFRNLTNFSRHIGSLYAPGLNGLCWHIQWQDEDGDMITIRTDDDLSLVLGSSPPNASTTLRLHIEVHPQQKQEQQSRNTESPWPATNLCEELHLRCQRLPVGPFLFALFIFFTLPCCRFIVTVIVIFSTLKFLKKTGSCGSRRLWRRCERVYDVNVTSESRCSLRDGQRHVTSPPLNCLLPQNCLEAAKETVNESRVDLQSDTEDARKKGVEGAAATSAEPKSHEAVVNWTLDDNLRAAVEDVTKNQEKRMGTQVGTQRGKRNDRWARELSALRECGIDFVDENTLKASLDRHQGVVSAVLSEIFNRKE